MNQQTLESVQQLVQESAAHFWTAPGTTLTCCVLVLRDGFTVVGKSACMDKAQFDIEIGRKMAFDDAVSELIRLESYKQATSGPRIEIAGPHQVPGLTGHG